MKGRLSISFSGGRTSAYMTWRLLHQEKVRDHFDVEVLFANTGQEHEKTLEFVDRCDREFGFGVTWLEAVVHHGEKKGSTHRVVSFETASRQGEPFEEVIRKYGIPNPDFQPCTRELKTNVMRSYVRSLGWEPGAYRQVVGIRADEMDRVNPDYKRLGLWYPLLDWGVDKPIITAFWARQPFDLEIPEHLGNCTWCWKKSLRKHLTLAKDHPEVFEFPHRMERQYAYAGARKPGEENIPRRFFRNHMTVNDLFSMAGRPFVPFAEGDAQKQMSILADMDRAHGCSESCEAFGEGYEEDAA